MIEQAAICGLCPHGCWVKAYVSNGKLVSVAPDPHPNYGGLCERGRLAPQIVYSSERIKTPLIRTGPKGTTSFREASWNEALDRITTTFCSIRDRSGARAVTSYMGAGTLEDGLAAFYKILEPFGSPNDMDCGSICYVSSRVLAPLTTFGIEADCVAPDFDEANTVVLWGTNPLKDGIPDKMQRIRKARDNGAVLIVVDPRRTRLAREADLWVPVLPGTDGALALGLISLLIRTDSYDQDFVDRWTTGFEELAAYASLFDPETVGRICGIEPALVLRFANLLSRSKRTALDFYSGIEYAPSGVQTARALYSLAALTGGIDAAGGLTIRQYPHRTVTEHGYDPASPPLGAQKYPLYYALTGRAHMAGFADAVLHGDPYPVHGLLLIGGSPMLSYPDSQKWRQVYEQLEFLAVIDRFLPEEAAWADVIIPAATYYETDSYHRYRDHVRRRRKIIEPVGQAKPDAWILSALADRLGYGDFFPRTPRQIIEHSFRHSPHLLSELADGSGSAPLPIPPQRTRKYESGHLRSDGKPGFPTASGKFEFSSTLLARYGYDALPVYRDPRTRENGHRPLPLMLTTGARTKSRFNSQYLERPELGVRNDPVLEIHPADAAVRGVQQGDAVCLQTSAGTLYFEAFLTEHIRPGVVHAPAGGGSRRQPGVWRCANVNSIVPGHATDLLSGYPVVKAVPCEVASVREGELRRHRQMENQVVSPTLPAVAGEQKLLG